MTDAILKPGDMIVPFGTTSWTAERMALDARPDGGWEHDCPVGYAVIGKGRGHRLFGAVHKLPVPTHLEPDDHSGMITFLNNRARGLCDIFNKRQAEFITHYFAFIKDHLAEHGGKVDAMAAEFHGLYAPEHWLFAAFAPLPQAHIYVGDEGAERFVLAPLALWCDEGCIAIYFAGAETAGGKTASDQARLRHAGAIVLELSEAEHESPTALAAALPEAVKYFWRSQPLPMGPFAAELADFDK